MNVWRLTERGRVSMHECDEPEDVRQLLQCEAPHTWLFDYLVLQTLDYNVYMFYAKDGQYAKGFNILCLRILVDLDMFEGSHRTFQGEGMHNHVPRGPAIFFKMTHETADNVQLLTYEKVEFQRDWPLFFRVGITLPYCILEDAFAETNSEPNDVRLRVCSWDSTIINWLVKRVKKRVLSASGDRDRVLGWVTAVCARRLYTQRRWDMVDLTTLMKQTLK